MDIIREEDDSFTNDRLGINRASLLRQIGDQCNGGPPAVRRKLNRSFSTPGNVAHPSEDPDPHESYHHSNEHHVTDTDDDVPLLSDDDDHAHRRMSVPTRLPVRDVTAESLGLRTYKVRFYILFVFCLTVFVNGMVTYMFISVAKTVEFVYDMTYSELFLLQNCTGIGFLIGVWPCCWIMERYGLRLAVVLSAFVQFLGALLKIPILFFPNMARTSFLLGTLIASLAGPLSLVAPTALSSMWFPMNERALSTALGAYSLGLGIGLIVVIEPYFLSFDVQNCTNMNSSHPSSNQTASCKEELFSDMMLIFYMQLGLTAFCLILTLVYFPNKPKMPPTLSAGVQRMNIWRGLKQLLRSSDYHVLVVINIQYSIGMSYQSALDELLSPLGFSETDVGIMGGLMLVAGTVAALVGGWYVLQVYRFGYCFNKHLKLVLIILFLFSGFPCVWFALTVLGYLPPHKALVYSSVVLSGVGLNAPAALFFEAIIEQTYPVGEAVSIGWLTFIGNFVRSSLFALPMIPGVGKAWLNWLMIGVAFLPMPMLFMYKQKYKRLDLDLTAGSSTVAT